MLWIVWVTLWCIHNIQFVDKINTEIKLQKREIFRISLMLCVSHRDCHPAYKIWVSFDINTKCFNRVKALQWSQLWPARIAILTCNCSTKVESSVNDLTSFSFTTFKCFLSYIVVTVSKRFRIQIIMRILSHLKAWTYNMTYVLR